MNASTRTTPPAPPIPRSVLFQAPGTPPDAAHRLEVRQNVLSVLQRLAGEFGFETEVRANSRVLRLQREGLSPAWLGDFLEAGLKRAAARLSADLIGGTNVTRLDRTITASHPRLPYRKAIRVVNARGWSLALGEDLPEPAQATLIRFCGLLPVQVLYLPGQPRPRSLAGLALGLSYILPLAGETLRGAIHEPGDRNRAVCHLDLDRLLQFFLGLESAGDVAAEAGART